MLSQRDAGILETIFNSANRGEIALEETSGQEIESFDIRAQQLEMEAISLIEKGEQNYQEALRKFSDALDIDLRGCNGSVYNNRAQLYRILKQESLALQDIEKAIMYGSSKICKQSYTQRAIIRHNQGMNTLAQQDFALGAKCGNPVAKAMVKSNPYAKLCNSILTTLMK